MARELSLSGGDISVIKALGLSGGQVGGKTLVDRIGGMETAEIIDTLDSLIALDYVQSDTEKVRSLSDLQAAKFNVNTAVIRDLREALNPAPKKENKPTRQRRG